MVDAASGELVLDLGEWQPLPHHTGPELGLLLTRYHRLDQAGQTWFARLHPDSPRLEVLGATASGPNGCLASSGYVACDARDEIPVWRVR